jgi:multifunctional methyltransferase subunit TRM112
MRLITHNMLKCNVKGVENGYPLLIEADGVEEVEAENPFDVTFMRGLLQKVNLVALKSAASNLQMDTFKGVDVNDKEAVLANEALLQQLHHLLFEIHIDSGKLTCPESGRVFVIADGVPNMLLHEDEIN